MKEDDQRGVETAAKEANNGEKSQGKMKPPSSSIAPTTSIAATAASSSTTNTEKSTNENNTNTTTTDNNHITTAIVDESVKKKEEKGEKPGDDDEEEETDDNKEMVGGCCVCADDNGTADNLLVYCDGDGCRVAVHEACYGIRNLPKDEWFCRACEHKNKLLAEHKSSSSSSLALLPSNDLFNSICCQFCPLREGALKICDNGKWSHVVCALYIPEVTFGSIRTMEPIIDRKSVV